MSVFFMGEMKKKNLPVPLQLSQIHVKIKTLGIVLSLISYDSLFYLLSVN